MLKLFLLIFILGKAFSFQFGSNGLYNQETRPRNLNLVNYAACILIFTITTILKQPE